MQEIKGIHIRILEETRKKPLCINEVKKNLSIAYDYAQHEISRMIKINLLQEVQNTEDSRKKFVSPTKQGILILRKSRAKKNFIARFDAYLEEGLEEVGNQLLSELKQAKEFIIGRK